jgi:transposase
MAGITITTNNGIKTIFRTFSYRNSNNKSVHDRKVIGRINTETNEPIFNRFFKTLVASQGLNINEIKSIPIHNIPKFVDFGTLDKQNIDIINLKDDEIVTPMTKITIEDDLLNENGLQTIEIDDNTILIFPETDITSLKIGPQFILHKITNKTGLLDILKDVFPVNWQEIITIAYFLVNTNEPVMYCQNWVEQTKTFLDSNNLYSQRISEILSEINSYDINRFYNKWTEHTVEDGYVALDITSISSYSKFISYIEPGYNRNDEKLPQLNLSLLFGEKSGLPIFSTFYTGSINDVKTITSCIAHLEAINIKKSKLVMDKGFYSYKNISLLLNKYEDHKFLIAMPFTNDLAKTISNNNEQKFEDKSGFTVGNTLIRAYSCLMPRYYNDKLIYHVFYNKKLYEDVKEEKIKDATIKLEEAIKNPEVYKDNEEYTNVLIFKKDKKNGNYLISINFNKIYNEIRNTGKLIIVSNDKELNYQEVLKIYRNKDCVEKAFNRLKSHLDLYRLRIHDDKRLEGKLFIAFIALVINSFIHKTMKANKLYEKYTLDLLIKELEKIKIYNIGEKQFLSPISKANKHILSCFDIKVK